MSLRKSGLYEKISGKEFKQRLYFLQALLTGSLLLTRCKNNGPIGSSNGKLYFLVYRNPRMKLNQVLANLSGCSLESPVGLEEKKKAGEEKGRRGEKRVKGREALLPQKQSVSRC